MMLDLGEFTSSEEVRKAETRLTVGGNPLITRSDFDKLRLNELTGGETFTGKVQVSRILEKDDKSYNTAIIEVFNDDDKEVLTLFVNFDSRNEFINVDDSFDFYIDMFNLCKSLVVMQGGSTTLRALKHVNSLKFLQALDSLESVEVVVIEKENSEYNTFILKEVV